MGHILISSLADGQKDMNKVQLLSVCHSLRDLWLLI